MKESVTKELLNIVKRNYQDIALEFDATRKKEIWPEIRDFANRTKDGESILDLGCGNGRLIEAFKDKDIKYLGVDNSRELIELAKKNYPSREFIKDDILDLKKVPNNKFDSIFCLAVLQHIPSRKLRVGALELMSSKLKKDGEIIISNWNLWSQKKYRAMLLKNYWLKLIGKNDLGYNDLVFPWKNVNCQKASDRYYHAFTKNELKKIARLAKLKIVIFKKDKYNFWIVLKKHFPDK